MSDIRANARATGLIYLAVAVTGAFNLLYLPSLIVAGDPALTATNLRANEWTFRLGVLSGLVCQVLFVFLAVALHRLFRHVNEWQAKTMVALVLVGAPVAFLNTLNQLAALHALTGATYLNAFGPAGRNELATFLLNVHAQGLMIVGLFWGLWLLPFGLLAIKSGFMPKTIGVLLIVACAGYVVDVFIRMLAPGMAAAFAPVAGLAKVGELAVIAWLLFGRVRGAESPYILATTPQRP